MIKKTQYLIVIIILLGSFLSGCGSNANNNSQSSSDNQTSVSNFQSSESQPNDGIKKDSKGNRPEAIFKKYLDAIKNKKFTEVVKYQYITKPITKTEAELVESYSDFICVISKEEGHDTLMTRYEVLSESLEGNEVNISFRKYNTRGEFTDGKATFRMKNNAEWKITSFSGGRGTYFFDIQ